MKLSLWIPLLVACGSSATDEPDAPPQPLHDFSCVGVPWPATAPDPLRVKGIVNLGGATAEIHDVATDGLLGMATTSTSPADRGRYTVDIATGGEAPTIYRKFTAAGQLDTYAYDSFPLFDAFDHGNLIIDQSLGSAFYSNLGLSYDASKAIVLVHVFDCTLPTDLNTTPMVGATVEPPPGAHVLYVPADGVFTSQTANLNRTTAAGQAILVGVTPGTVDIAVHAGDVTYRSWPITARAGSYTWSVRRP